MQVQSAPSPRFLTAAADTAQVPPRLPVQGSVPEAAFLGSASSHHAAPNMAGLSQTHVHRGMCTEAGIAEILIKESVSDISI